MERRGEEKIGAAAVEGGVPREDFFLEEKKKPLHGVSFSSAVHFSLLPLFRTSQSALVDMAKKGEKEEDKETKIPFGVLISRREEGELGGPSGFFGREGKKRKKRRFRKKKEELGKSFAGLSLPLEAVSESQPQWQLRSDLEGGGGG